MNGGRSSKSATPGKSKELDAGTQGSSKGVAVGNQGARDGYGPLALFLFRLARSELENFNFTFYPSQDETQVNPIYFSD